MVTSSLLAVNLGYFNRKLPGIHFLLGNPIGSADYLGKEQVELLRSCCSKWQ